MSTGTSEDIFKSYKPPKLKANGNMMTILSKFSRHVKVEYIRERLRTPDRDFFDIDWMFPTGKKVEGCYDGILLIAHHGLGGSSQSQYILKLASVCKGNGIIFVAINARCSSGEPNETACMYSAGSTSDLKQALGHVSKLYPKASIFMVGYSIGGSMTANAVGEMCRDKDIDPNLKGAITISSPIDLSLGTKLLNKSKMGKFYTAYLLNGLKHMLKQKLKLRNINDERIKKGIKCKTIKEFDDIITAPLRGWKDSDEYYEKESPSNVLKYVTIPMCMLHSKDDPIVNIQGATDYIKEKMEKNENIEIFTTIAGGHCIFESSSDEFWLEHFIIAWCKEHLKSYDKFNANLKQSGNLVSGMHNSDSSKGIEVIDMDLGSVLSTETHTQNSPLSPTIVRPITSNTPSVSSSS